MPVKWTSYFGSQLHGVDITWGNDPAAGVGTAATLNINFKLNMYAAKFTAGLIDTEADYVTPGWDTKSLTTIDKKLEKPLSFLLGWKNPFAGAPTYDGFNARLKAVITGSAGGAKPDMKINWILNSAAVVYDTKPTKVDETTVVYDVNKDAAKVPAEVFDNVTPVASEASSDLCKEKWTYSNTSVSCVLVEGNLTRKFKTVDPFNVVGATKQDLDLDYTTYKIHVMFGEITSADLMYGFTELTVNYDYFNEDSLAGAFSSISQLSLASVSALAILLSW